MFQLVHLPVLDVLPVLAVTIVSKACCKQLTNAALACIHLVRRVLPVLLYIAWHVGVCLASLATLDEYAGFVTWLSVSETFQAKLMGSWRPAGVRAEHIECAVQRGGELAHRSLPLPLSSTAAVRPTPRPRPVPR